MPIRRFEYCVLGAGVAGTTAVETIREADRVADIALVTDEPHLMYYRPRLPGYVGGHVRLESIVERDAGWARMRRIELFQPACVSGLDSAARTVTLVDGRILRYDKLLIATGARPRRLGVPGEELDGVSPLWSLADADRIRAMLAHARHAVVVGGGFISAELVEAFRLHGIQVTYVIRGPRWFHPFTDEAAGAMVAEELRAHGIVARFATRVSEILGRGGAVCGVRLDTGDVIPADLVSVSLGARWEMDWFTAAGGRMGRGALTDEWLRTDLDGVWAAGDAADPLNPSTGTRVKTFNVFTAGLQGKMAALGMVGTPQQMQRLPWYGFRLLGLFFTFIGMVDTRDPSLSSWTDLDPGERSYTRIFTRGRQVVGALLINSTLAQPVRRFAESGRVLPADPSLIFRRR
jgi:3-phenylpropionate/trans-cinnamate dioxygenase ferredoxin reductase subunit